MPHIPHFYTLRVKAAHDEDFIQLVECIRSYGYDESWGRMVLRYLDLDGWKYWTMGARVESTSLVNRARLDRPERSIVQNPRPFRPTIEWHEVFCPITKSFVPKQSELRLDGSE